jgi:hypothetical protein
VLAVSPAQVNAMMAAVERQARRAGQRVTTRAGRRPRARPEDAVDFIPPDQVEAMEIYRGAAQVPAQYNKTAEPGEASGCVILIWTR